MHSFNATVWISGDVFQTTVISCSAFQGLNNQLINIGAVITQRIFGIKVRKLGLRCPTIVNLRQCITT
jgi:hypothetical protein